MESKQQKDKTITYPKKLTLKVSGKDSIKDREFLIEGGENIKTSAGNFESVKIIRKSGTRTTVFWMAKKLNYIPIKIYQEKEGEEQATMILSYIQFQDKNKP